MKSVLIVCSYLIVISFITSCEYVEGLHKKGEIVETEVWIDEFDAIQVDSPIRLILEQSSKQYAKISGLDFKVHNMMILTRGIMMLTRL